MKYRPKKKESKPESSAETEQNEAGAALSKLLAVKELLAKSGLTSFVDGNPLPDPDDCDIEEDDDEEIDESPKWKVQIDGMIPMEAKAAKFSLFTPGESSSGQMVIEFKSKPGVNPALFGWLKKPSERKITMTVHDHDDNRIEQWEMATFPVAIAVDELDRDVKDPWFITLQVSVKDIKIT